MKPFIHLVESVKSKAFYDVNTNSLVRVNDEVYSRLKKLMSPEHPGEDYRNEPLFQKLLEDGYLLDKRVEKIEHPATRTLADDLDRSLRLITLQVTQGCNLRCGYCAYTDGQSQRSHSDKTMTFETAKAAIDFLMAHSVDSEMVSVGFYGGEPLLRLDLIKQVLNYIKIEYPEKNTTYSMTTNATLITNEVLELFSEKKFSLLISLDGPKKIHDTNRRYAADGIGSFKDVIANIRRIVNWNKIHENQIEFSINMVMDQRLDFEEWKRLYIEVPELDSVRTQTTLVNPTLLSNEYRMSPEFADGYFYDQFWALLDYFGFVKGLDVPPFLRSMVVSDIAKLERLTERHPDSLPDITAPGGPCVPGKSRLLVDTDGNLFPCERVSEDSEVLKIGSVYAGFDIEKCRSLLNIGQLTTDECKNCWAFSRCDICVRLTAEGDNLSGSAKLENCRRTKQIVHAMIELELVIEDLKEFAKKKNQDKQIVSV